jgi:hypothetical protein
MLSILLYEEKEEEEEDETGSWIVPSFLVIKSAVKLKALPGPCHQDQFRDQLLAVLTGWIAVSTIEQSEIKATNSSK